MSGEKECGLMRARAVPHHFLRDTTMQTRTHHRSTKERLREVRTETRQETTDVAPRLETEPARKPLVAFEELPTRTAPPLTWD
jgi:hypothetical protein